MGRDETLNPHNQGQPLIRTAAYDRLGRILASGDLVVLLNQGTILWRVQETKPNLNPAAPPGLVELSLVAVFAQGVPGGTPIGDIVRVRSAGEEQVNRRQES